MTGQYHVQQEDGGGLHEDSSVHLQDCVRDHRTRPFTPLIFCEEVFEGFPTFLSSTELSLT